VGREGAGVSWSGGMSEVTTTAQEILSLRNRVEQLEADVAVRNRVLRHLDDKTDAETIVAAMKTDLLHAVLGMFTPPRGGGKEAWDELGSLEPDEPARHSLTNDLRGGGGKGDDA
jgi:hypothetical protein